MKTKLKVIFATTDIEVQSADTVFWQLVKSGMALDIADRIRMPPASLLKLQWGDEKFLLTQCQEGTISHLMQQTFINTTPYLQRSQAAEKTTYKKPLYHDGLSEASTGKLAISNSFTQQLNIEALNQIAVPDKEMVKYVSEILKGNHYPVDRYPYKNLGKAIFLFNFIGDLMIQERPLSADIQSPRFTLESKSGHDLDIALLYLTWLRACDMKAEVKKQADQCFIIFNTEVEEADELTANTRLYKVKEQQVWIPLLMKLSDPNFVRCWYHGAAAWKAE